MEGPALILEDYCPAKSIQCIAAIMPSSEVNIVSMKNSLKFIDLLYDTR
jgi:hypothetical protein